MEHEERSAKTATVETLVNAVDVRLRAAMRWAVHACMLAIAVFMLGYGVHLCLITWQNTVAEFPGLSVGVVYMPIPVAGALTLLFIVEKLWLGEPPKSDPMYRDQAADLE